MTTLQIRKSAKRAGLFLLILIAPMLGACGSEPTYSAKEPTRSEQEKRSAAVMLILRGIANAESPRGQLDDQSALEYARRVGFRGEVLDVAAGNVPDNEQVKMALARIRRDDSVRAIYGFSGGGYNARHVWQELDPVERKRLQKIVVIGAPGVSQEDFTGTVQVIIRQDPPEGHLAGPKALLGSR
jgi:hypothetical protein